MALTPLPTIAEEDLRKKKKRTNRKKRNPRQAPYSLPNSPPYRPESSRDGSPVDNYYDDDFYPNDYAPYDGYDT
jgi:hypothetical protein